MVIFAFLQIWQLLPMTIGGNVTTRLIDNQGTLTRLCNTSGRPSAGFIPPHPVAGAPFPLIKRKRSSPLLSAVADSEGLLFIMPHRRDSAIFVMLRIPADVTDSLRCFLLRPGIVDQLERLSPGSSLILIFDCKI